MVTVYVSKKCDKIVKKILTFEGIENQALNETVDEYHSKKYELYYNKLINLNNTVFFTVCFIVRDTNISLVHLKIFTIHFFAIFCLGKFQFFPKKCSSSIFLTFVKKIASYEKDKFFKKDQKRF